MSGFQLSRKCAACPYGQGGEIAITVEGKFDEQILKKGGQSQIFEEILFFCRISLQIE